MNITERIMAIGEEKLPIGQKMAEWIMITRYKVISMSQKVVMNNAQKTGNNGLLRLKYAHVRENKIGRAHV